MNNSPEYLTKQEKKDPIGKIQNGLEDKEIISRLKDIDFLTQDLKLTERGKEYTLGKLQELNSVERIMIERFILEHHEVEKEILY